jgi:beta-barrel assembly-enhancing protease
MGRRDFLWLAGATGGGVLVAGLPGCAVDPVSGDRRLMLLSERDEIDIDREHAPHQFSNDYGRVDDPMLLAYVDDVGQRVARLSHRPHMPYSFHVVNANHLNAYAFPGGTIACTRGLMVEMEDESELAALMGHESGHVAARHAAKRQTQAMLTALALGGVVLAAGRSSRLDGYQDVIYGIGALGAGALLAYYSRENEREADALGQAYATSAGYNPDGMVSLIGTLMEEGSRDRNALELMFATHPMATERLRSAERDAQTYYASARDRARGRERHMDHTARLRQRRELIGLLRRGESAMAAGRHRQAEEHFRQAIAIDGSDYSALLLMSQCQSALGRHREAQRYLEQAKAVSPGEGKALHLSGVNRLALGQPDRALADLQRYERQLPGNPNTQFLKGVAYESMQQRQAAAQHYVRYVRVAPDTQQAAYARSRLQAWQ